MRYEQKFLRYQDLHKKSAGLSMKFKSILLIIWQISKTFVKMSNIHRLSEMIGRNDLSPENLIVVEVTLFALILKSTKRERY